MFGILSGLATPAVAVLYDLCRFGRDELGRSVDSLLFWRCDGRLELFRQSNGRSLDDLLGRTIGRVDADFAPAARKEFDFRSGFEFGVLGDHDAFGSAGLEAVNGVAVLDVLCLFVVECHGGAFVESDLEPLSFVQLCNRSKVAFSYDLLRCGFGQPDAISLGEFLLFLTVDLALGGHGRDQMRAVRDLLPMGGHDGKLIASGVRADDYDLALVWNPLKAKASGVVGVKDS